jgi:oxygen-dependent protoporphyrinogen oxidase
MSPETRRVIGFWGAFRCTFEPWLPKSVGQHATSLGCLVKARLGKRTLERLVAPVVRGVYSSSPMLLPLEAVPGLAKTYAENGSLRVAARRQRGSVRASGAAVAGVHGGMYTLVYRLREELERLGVRVRTDAEVTEVRVGGQGCRVVAANAAATEADVVLVTASGVCEPTDQSDCAKDVRQDATTRPSDEVGSVEVIALMLDDSRLNSAPRGTGALVSEDARRATPAIQAKALTHVNVKWAWLAAQLPEHRHLIRLSYGERGSVPATIDTSDDEALKIALVDASAILGIDLDPESVVGLRRQTHVVRSCHPVQGVLERQESGSRTTPERVFVAGEWVAGAGLAAVVPSARAAAQSILATVGIAPEN